MDPWPLQITSQNSQARARPCEANPISHKKNGTSKRSHGASLGDSKNQGRQYGVSLYADIICGREYLVFATEYMVYLGVSKNQGPRIETPNGRALIKPRTRTPNL